MLLRTVRALAADVIAPRAAHYDRTAEFPWDNVEAINALGLNAMFVPEAYGGAPVSYCAYLACVREISKACAATGSVWSTTFHAMKPLIDFGTDEQKRRLLPKIAAGGLRCLVHHRARCRLGRHRHAHAFVPGWRPDPDRRRQDLHHQRQRRRPFSPVRQVERDRGPAQGDLGAGGRGRHARPLGGAHRGQDGHPRVLDRDARLRGLPRAARQPSGRAGRRPCDPARGTQQVAPLDRGARARHRAGGLRGRHRLHQPAPPVGPEDRRVPGHPVPARRPRERAGALRALPLARGCAGRCRRERHRHRGLARSSCAPPISRCA